MLWWEGCGRGAGALGARPVRRRRLEKGREHRKQSEAQCHVRAGDADCDCQRHSGKGETCGLQQTDFLEKGALSWPWRLGKVPVGPSPSWGSPRACSVEEAGGSLLLHLFLLFRMRSSVHRKEFPETEQENQFNYKINQKKEAKIRSA